MFTTLTQAAGAVVEHRLGRLLLIAVLALTLLGHVSGAIGIDALTTLFHYVRSPLVWVAIGWFAVNAYRLRR